ncbi:MAG: alkaline phosphatase family protein [Acidimicrobiales bacterium]
MRDALRSRLMKVLHSVEARRVRSHPHPGGFERPRPDLPAGTDTLPKVRHIVVLMMENHSFDNYFGTLGRGDGLPDLTANLTRSGDAVRAHRLTTTTQRTGVPNQSWESTHEQWNEGANDGFVRSAESQRPHVPGDDAMGHWTDEDLPFYAGLARTFPLCDRWFSSCLGPTFPNRRFLVAGTARGLDSDELKRTIDRPEAGTLFDLLTRHGISWADYHPISHARPLMARAPGLHGTGVGRRLRTLMLKDRIKGDEGELKSLLQFTADAFPLGLVTYLGHVHSIERFESDAVNGTLPDVSIVDPDFRANSEENPQDIADGEAFAARIINAVMHGRSWRETLLVWCYDEHGGYYDHVPPPAAPEPDDHPPEHGGPYRYDRYGFRVPAVIVSPYARPDYVSHVTHDHTSILKLIETKWNLPPLTRRDAAADDLLDSVDFDAPPSFAEPPDLPAPARLAAQTAGK